MRNRTTSYVKNVVSGPSMGPSEATREAAYAASMIYCGPMMRNAVPTLPSIQALQRDLCAHRAFNAYQ